MDKKTISATCSDPTRNITIELPCGLAERAQKHAEETETTLSGVVIEALDTFLRIGRPD